MCICNVHQGMKDCEKRGVKLQSSATSKSVQIDSVLVWTDAGSKTMVCQTCQQQTYRHHVSHDQINTTIMTDIAILSGLTGFPARQSVWAMTHTCTGLITKYTCISEIPYRGTDLLFIYLKPLTLFPCYINV